MNKKSSFFLVLLALLLLTLPVWAQSGGGYDLSWSTVDGGGYTFSSSGSYTLGGTIGQPDAGLLTGGNYALGGGFWGGGAVAAAQYRVYLPLVHR
ncbi:MAG: hypothetical protein P8129_16125 [Anaerolineae bacterium]